MGECVCILRIKSIQNTHEVFPQSTGDHCMGGAGGQGRSTGPLHASTAIDRNKQRPQHLVEELPGGRDCTSSGSCLVVACRVGRCSWWCLGRLVRPAGASHGTCSWWCLGRTSVLPVPHTELLVSGGASDGLAKICRCLTRINAHVLFRR